MPSLPLLALTLAAYNLVILLRDDQALTAVLWTIGMDSGAIWSIDLDDLFRLSSLALLFVELIRATAIGTATLINHILSMLVFVIGLVEFLVMPGFGNSTFFLVMLMALLDVVAGFIITAAATRMPRRGAKPAQRAHHGAVAQQAPSKR